MKKTVFITGASRGIGRALAEKFLSEGFFVIGTSRTESVDFSHDHFVMLPLEITDVMSRATCIEKIRFLNRGIDILVNNVGIWDARDEGPEVHEDALRRTLEANLIGPIAFTEALLQNIKIGGHILNISSRRASLEQTGHTLYPAYSISKVGLNMFTRKLAARLGENITVSCVHPGSVRTEMNPDGELSLEESAQDLFNLVTSRPPTGLFWYKGETMPW